MIPKVNGRGHSFNGIMAYLMHDKEAHSDERVQWHQTGNIATNDPVKAAKIMAWTDTNAFLLKQEAGGSLAGVTAEAGAVYHYSLSWAHDESPDQEHQHAQALATLQRLGLSEHQYVIVAHDDTDHAHVHVVANLTHPETGKRHDVGLDQPALQSWALEYEREHGIQCKQREINAQAREAGEPTKYRDQKQDYSISVTRAYYAADSGKAFINALEAEGLQLAAARRGNGFVVVDEKGDIQKLARQLEIEESGKAKTAAINSKLADIDRDSLPDADKLSKQLKENHRYKDMANDLEDSNNPIPESAPENTPEPDVLVTHDEAAMQLPDAQPHGEAPEEQSMWDIMNEYLADMPDEPPLEPPQEPPHEAPQIIVDNKKDRNRGFNEQISAISQWMQDKLVSAYEYMKQQITQQHDKNNDKER